MRTYPRENKDETYEPSAIIQSAAVSSSNGEEMPSVDWLNSALKNVFGVTSIALYCHADQPVVLAMVLHLRLQLFY